MKNNYGEEREDRVKNNYGEEREDRVKNNYGEERKDREKIKGMEKIEQKYWKNSGKQKEEKLRKNREKNSKKIEKRIEKICSKTQKACKHNKNESKQYILPECTACPRTEITIRINRKIKIREKKVNIIKIRENNTYFQNAQPAHARK